jgi:hypothetical protein
MQEVSENLAREEASPMSAEERHFHDKALEAVSLERHIFSWLAYFL